MANGPVPRPELDDASTVRELELDDVPGKLRWLLLLQNGLAPFVWYTLLAARPSSSPAHLLLAWLGLWLCTVLATGLGVRRWPFHMVAPVALALSIAASLAWARGTNHGDSVWLFPLLVAGTLYRVRRFLADTHLHDENRLAFRVDCVLVVAGLLGCSVTVGREGLAFAFAAANGLVAILSRLYTLWRLERLAHGSEGASKATWGWMAACLILLALLGILFGPYLVYGSLLLFGLLMSPFAWLLPRNPHLSALPMQQENNSTNDVLYSNAYSVHQHASGWVGAVLLMAVLGGGLLLLRKRLGPRGTKQAEGKEEVATSRRWLGRSDGLQLLPTDNAVRLEMQKWIRDQQAKGNTMKPHETASAFLQRTVGPDVSHGPNGMPADFAHRYNQVRYRGETTEGQ